MIGSMKLSELVQPLSGVMSGNDVNFTDVCTDTRAICPGSLFVALKGPNFDAHDFLSTAKEKSASAALVEKNGFEGLSTLKVADTRKAFGSLGALNRARFDKTVIGITGSSGKTTVKKMVATILGEVGCVHATSGNFNNEIGVPITLLKIEDRHDYAVVEMGTSSPGEIAYLADLVQPDIALVTNVGTAHFEGFGSSGAIAEEKGSIYEGIRESGTAVINLDDQFAGYWLERLTNKSHVTFSLANTDADIYASKISVKGLEGVTFNLHANDAEISICLPMLGEHNALNAISAAAVTIVAGASLDQVKSGLSKVEPESRRLNLNKGPNGALLIDDSYNANPASVRAAIDVLADFDQLKKVLVLGDLAELGPSENEIHRDLGVYASEQGVDLLLTCGPRARFAADAFGKHGESFDSHESIVKRLKDELHGNSVALIKGSRSAAMDIVADALVECGDA